MLAFVLLLLAFQAPLDPDFVEWSPVVEYPQIYINPYFWIFPLESGKVVQEKPALPIRIVVPDSQVIDDVCEDLDRALPVYSF